MNFHACFKYNVINYIGMKFKTLIVSILFLQAFFNPSLIAYSEQVFTVQNMADMLTHVDAVDIEFSGDNSTGHFSYSVVGSETIDSKQTWKVLTTFGEEDDDQSYTIWVDKNTGKTVQVEINDQVFQDMFAEMYGNITLSFFMGFVYNYWSAWSYEGFLDYGYGGLGVVTPLGKQVKTFGPTTLETWGVSYDGYVTGDETVNYLMEVWYAPTQFGGIMTYMSMSTSGAQNYNMELKLISISLVESQQVPNEFLELLEEQTEPEPEP